MRSRLTVPFAALILSSVASAADPAAIDFDRQIRPILSDKCFACHGPDEAARQSGLRLDLRDDALKPADSGTPAIVPGDVASELVARIEAIDPDVAMPPADANKPLTAEEKELLRRWVVEGAEYRRHWAFEPVARPAVPRPRDMAWPRNDLDRFILARLESEGLAPAPEADRETLIRRVTLDLTGLPPTPDEIDAFLADRSPNAYEKVVARLLSDPHYGERMAVDWLDASRYADTHGYHIDSGRDMTRWREWVIAAFNDNKPFDRFTVEQLAGDLLPDATLDQKIASGFHRNHMINFEGGAIPEEYHAAYIVDRVNTTGTVWLGLTVACAQCHDHKYDPIAQKEYYGLYAFFHNVPEKGLDGIDGNAAPFIRVPSPEQQAAIDKLRAEVARVEQDLAAPRDELDRAQQAWELSFASAAPPEWTAVTVKAAGGETVSTTGGATVAYLDDASVRLTGPNPPKETYVVTVDASGPLVRAFKLDLLPEEGLNGKGPGRSDNGNIVLTGVRVAASDKGAPAPVEIESAFADFSQKDFEIAKAIDADPAGGWAIYPEVGKPHSAVFALKQPIGGSARVTVSFEFHSQFAGHHPGRFRLSTTPSENFRPIEGLPPAVVKALGVPAAERSDADKTELRRYFREQIAPETRGLVQELKKFKDDLAALDKAIPTAMVMQEMAMPRDTFVLVRGEYDKKGEKVTPTVPAALPPLPDGVPRNRLGLAQWLVAPQHPLTSRVIANRYWQMFFGTGLVKTADDFGSQGERPSHPELLDWLAAEFMHGPADGSGSVWDVKALVRLMVTSATYRQSSAAPRGLYDQDPENRLLARGPRFRLQAEFIRDQALAASGLLDRRIGGESVSPYQPPGLWEELMSREDGDRFSAQKYVQSTGPDLYRRTMYTFWKRTCPPPTLATFDAPDRETCTVRRARTNTPLQALVLLNDPTYVEASRKLAERLLAQAGPSAEERVTLLYRLTLARNPRDPELSILRDMLAGQLEKYRNDPQAAEKLLAVGESPRDPRFDPAELAAWSTVAAAVLNLDETVTRN